LQIFPTYVYFVSPLKGFPLELGTGAWGQKTRLTGLPGWNRSLMIPSAIWIQCTTWQTDRWMDTCWQLRLLYREYKKPSH